MLPETMFLMEKIRHMEIRRGRGGCVSEWENWPCSPLDRLVVFLLHLPHSLRRYLCIKPGSR
ncbi:UNVERIFIED_ORG: hypothetical protein QE446_002755 [Rhizobium sp. SORGH_AS260]|nr:hypothetical protein [Rhizobium sp. SORGH_AS_0285]MDP9754879.1 hypothetical protein [Rhizobium sp. SORGH_AS_0260]MDR6082465.1 hypothetical protein [Agrobacterium sp. SORGH_AS_0440]PTV71204.1 hypothetical protein DBL06_24130 [Agrobacterium pusense]